MFTDIINKWICFSALSFCLTFPLFSEDLTGFTVQDTILVEYHGKEKNVIIPENFGITGIGPKAFYNSDITSIAIPFGVAYIGESAFSECIKLKHITIPPGVTSIGENAFTWCYNLKSITVPTLLQAANKIPPHYRHQFSSLFQE